jgi:hypothetical protein
MIGWDGDARYKQQLLAIVDKKQARFRQVVASLQQSGQLLTVTEAATLQPRLEIENNCPYRTQRGCLPFCIGFELRYREMSNEQGDWLVTGKISSGVP